MSPYKVFERRFSGLTSGQRGNPRPVLLDREQHAASLVAVAAISVGLDAFGLAKRAFQTSASSEGCRKATLRMPASVTRAAPIGATGLTDVHPTTQSERCSSPLSWRLHPHQ